MAPAVFSWFPFLPGRPTTVFADFRRFQSGIPRINGIRTTASQSERRRNPPQHSMRRDDQDMELATPVRHESPAVPPERRVTDGDLLQRIADGDTAAFDI